jgi:hypothetical protein
MRNFIYVETSKYIECALTSYGDLVRKTKEFTDLKDFEEVDFNPFNFYLDPKVTRLIYNGESYNINKNFVDISRNMQFIVLQKAF